MNLESKPTPLNIMILTSVLECYAQQKPLKTGSLATGNFIADVLCLSDEAVQ